MNPIRWLRNLARRNAAQTSQAWGGRQAGEFVNTDTALQIAAVWACVRVIAESLGALPWHVYEKVPSGTRTRREQRDGDVAWLLQTQWNPEMTAVAGREAIAMHALTWGNGYAEIERTADDRVKWLWLITPDRVTPERMATGGLQYRINNGTGNDSIVPARDMFHLHGLSFDGITGYSPIAVAARSLGLSMALEKFGANFFQNGAHPGSVLEHPGKLNAEAYANLKTSVDAATSGGKALSVMILEDGLKWHPMRIPPEEAQFLESRKFQISEICRWFRVPPHMVADLDKATFSNIEHQQLEFVTHSLMPWCKRFETEADIKLFGRVNAGRVYTKLQLGGLLRGDLKARYDAYAVGRQWGWLSANDVRDLEDMNPVAGGEDYLAPLNMVPADMLRELAEAPEPAPVADDQTDDQTDDQADEADDETPPRVRAVR